MKASYASLQAVVDDTCEVATLTFPLRTISVDSRPKLAARSPGFWHYLKVESPKPGIA